MGHRPALHRGPFRVGLPVSLNTRPPRDRLTTWKSPRETYYASLRTSRPCSASWLAWRGPGSGFRQAKQRRSGSLASGWERQAIQTW
jgi:hypothetical protein